MIMTRKELVDMFVCLSEMDSNIKVNKWFSYVVMVNQKQLKDKAKAIIDISKPKKEYLEYNEKRTDILNTYGERDDLGKIITLNDSIKIRKNDIDECLLKLKELDVNYKEAIDERNNNLEEYYELLETEIDVDIETVPFKYVPDNISISELKTLNKMIIMPDKEEDKVK